MAPRRAAPPPPAPLFADCVFCVAGNLPLKRGTIALLLAKDHMGSTSSTAFSKKITHLITNQNELDRSSIKTSQAQAGNIPLVKLDWILDSNQAKKRLDITPYLLSTGATSSPPLTPAAPVTASTAAVGPPSTSGKRKASSNDDDEDKVAKSRNAPAKIRQPPVDRSCTLPSQFSVFVDHTVAWSARLNQTNIGQNNNKFYIIQLLVATSLTQSASSLTQFAVFTRWGRVGTNGQHKTDVLYSLSAAMHEFEKKFKSKTSNNWYDRDNFVKESGKYHLLPPDDGDSDDEEAEDLKKKKIKKEIEEESIPVPESKLHPKVQDLMNVIFNTSMMNRQMKELDYDTDKMPLGKLAKATILQGYEVLKQISAALDKMDMTSLRDLSSQFYTVIPHDFGRRVPPIINDAPTLKKKLEMLEALGEIEIAQKLMKDNKKADEAMIINPLDQQFASLKLNKLEPMDKSSERFKLIEQFVKNSHGKTHTMYNLVIGEVFDLDSQGETERFRDAGFDKLHNRRLLWHGSRLTNYVGILSQGLRIAPPEAPATGYMFDKGAYFADCVSKSANYCFTDRTNNTGLMLLCEVALGDMLEMENADSNAKANSQKAGKHSTKGLGHSYPDEAHDVVIEDNLIVQAGPLKVETPTSDQGYRLQYNEYIVYNTSQIKMRYLIYMKFDYSHRIR